MPAAGTVSPQVYCVAAFQLVAAVADPRHMDQDYVARQSWGYVSLER